MRSAEQPAAPMPGSGGRWGVFGAYALLLAAGSVAPGSTFEEVPPLFPHADKMAHLVAYAGLVAVFLWAAGRIRSASPGRARWVGCAVVGAVLYGALLEVCQMTLCAERTFSFADIAADAVGAAAAPVLLGLVAGGGATNRERRG